MMPYFFTPRHNPTHPCTTPPVYAHSMSDMYARVLRVRRTRLQQKTNCNICLQCTLQRSSASLRDSFGNWWKEEISIFPSAVFDSGKYFFKNFSTTSSQVLKLLPLKECNHRFASPVREKEKIHMLTLPRTSKYATP